MQTRSMFYYIITVMFLATTGCSSYTQQSSSSNNLPLYQNVTQLNPSTPTKSVTKQINATASLNPTLTNTPIPSPTLTYTPIPSPTLTNTPIPSPTLTITDYIPFKDSFTDFNGRLRQENYTNLTTTYDNSSFVMSIGDSQFTQLSEYNLSVPDNISLVVDISFGTQPDTWMGLVYRMNQEGYYMFVVDGKGNYKIISVFLRSISKTTTNPTVDILFEGYLPQRTEDLFFIETIRIDMFSNQFEFFANEILLTTLNDSSFESGNLGLIGWTTTNPDSIAFNSLEVIEYDQRNKPSSSNCSLIQGQLTSNSSFSDLQTQSLGPLGIDSVITMSVQPDDISKVFSARTLSKDDLIVMSRLTSPNGTVLYDINSSPEMSCTNNQYFSGSCGNEGEISLRFPANPNFPLIAGDYQIELYSINKPICDAVIITRTHNMAESLSSIMQAIDINIWSLSNSNSLVSPDKQTKAKQAIRQSIDSLLNQKNMRSGNINILSASDNDKLLFSNKDDRDLSNICLATTSAVGASRSINVALVDEFYEYDENDESLSPVLGMSPIPGVPFADSSVHSCVVISLEEHNNNYQYIGSTIIHEASHFMGLSHTTESDGLSFDLLDDTPTCPATVYDTNNNNEVEHSECSTEDGQNFMFWQDTGHNTLSISNHQAWIIRSHPLFYVYNNKP